LNAVHHRLYYKRVTEQGGRDAQQVVVSVRVLFVDPKSYGILVTRFTRLDQVAKPRVVDPPFLHSPSRMNGNEYAPVKPSAAHSRNLSRRSRPTNKRIWPLCSI
jgi:hypothetical protein